MNKRTALAHLPITAFLVSSLAACSSIIEPAGASHADTPVPAPEAATVTTEPIEAAAPPAEPAGDVERGEAGWYGDRYHGRKTASGERFDQHALTAAHRTLPFGTMVEVKNLDNGRTVTVRINDRGPFGRKTRIIDVSRAAATELDMVRSGVAPVELRIVGQPPPSS
jgi:rare lipoprotein A